MRAPHILKPKKHGMPHRDRFFYDTETTWIDLTPEEREARQAAGGDTEELIFGWVKRVTESKSKYSITPVTEWHRFETGADFIEWVSERVQPKRPAVIYAFNQGFDSRACDVFNLMMERGWEIGKSISLKRSATWWTFTHTESGRSLRFFDAGNWEAAGTTLKQVGASLGLDKGELDDEDQDAYCRRDVDILQGMVDAHYDYVTSNHLGGVQPTLPSQALQTFLHRFCPVPIFIDDNAKALEMSREALHGGRTECFFIGEAGGIQSLDFSSMYPSVMRGNRYPVKHMSNTGPMAVGRLVKYLNKGFGVVARVTVNTKRPIYASVLGGADGDRLCFPIGRFRTTLTTPELVEAIEHDELETVHTTAIYKQAEIFTQYVDYFFAHRLKVLAEGNDVWARKDKLLLNGLFGKFSQRGDRWETIGKSPDPDFTAWSDVFYDEVEGPRLRRLRQIGRNVQELQNAGGESLHSFPAISAHVTAFARLKLWRAIEAAGSEHVVYMDTDSLFTDAEGTENLRAAGILTEEKQLGTLNVETEPSLYNGHALKDYELGGKTARKGVRANAKQIAENVFEMKQFLSLEAALAQGRTKGIDWVWMRKTLQRSYRKGVVGPDGRVTPYQLDIIGGATVILNDNAEETEKRRVIA